VSRSRLITFLKYSPTATTRVARQGHEHVEQEASARRRRCRVPRVRCRRVRAEGDHLGGEARRVNSSVTSRRNEVTFPERFTASWSANYCASARVTLPSMTCWIARA